MDLDGAEILVKKRKRMGADTALLQESYCVRDRNYFFLVLAKYDSNENQVNDSIKAAKD